MQKKKINYLARTGNKKIFKNCKMINLHNPEKKTRKADLWTYDMVVKKKKLKQASKFFVMIKIGFFFFTTHHDSLEIGKTQPTK